MEYKTTIGLEIHAELNTKTKMFCNSKNDPEEKRPNVNICPVCLAHPGTLPVINKEAVKRVIKVGLALGANIADFTEFDRKNYFYPDIPKGYQISQYKYPIVSGGIFNNVKITRVHLEEDTAVSKHDRGDYSLVDFNRAGVPLMELVTEPVLHTAEDAAAFAKELQLLLRYLGVSEANLEKGEMRVEPNISVSTTDELGTKCEVKNLNSFKSVERAINYEVARHIALLEKGEKIAQETRGWDEAAQKTFSQRLKEDSHDYRYFPDPDLPKLKLSEAFDLEEMKKELPELPVQKRERYVKDFGIKSEDVETYVGDPKLASFFESVISGFGGDKSKIKIASNYITSDLLGLLKNNEHAVWPEADMFAELVGMIAENKVSSRGAKDILAVMVSSGGTPMNIAEEKGLLQKSDEGEIKIAAEKVITNNQKAVDEYKAGKESSIQFLVGQLMKETKGSANPAVAQKILRELLH